MSLVFEHLLIRATADGTTPQIKENWMNRLVKKHYDIPENKGHAFFPYSKYSLERSLYNPETGHDAALLKGEVRTSPFACCGMNELFSFGMGNVNNPDFLNEFWETYNKRAMLPVLFVLAKEGGEDLFPNYPFMRKHSHLVRKFRNIRYTNHILELRVFFHDEGKSWLFNSKQKEVPVRTFSEWFEQ